MKISENHNQLEYMWFVVNWLEQGEQEGKKKNMFVVYSYTGWNHNIDWNLME